MSKIIVGIDGSKGAQRALQWAVTEGGIRRCTVRVVYAVDWEIVREGIMIAPSEQEIDRDAYGVIDKSLKAVTVPSGASVEQVVLHSRDRRGAAGALADAADDSEDLLVVGSHGFSAVSGAVLGSISHRLLHYARCPVVVVPPPERT